MLRVIVGIALGAFAIVVLAVALFAAYCGAGWEADAQLDGTVAGMPVGAPVVVLRDQRGIPHIRARSMHDLMAAQGYVEASDRLFQIDLIRHLVYGRLAEWFGSSALTSDERARRFDIERVIEAEYQRLTSAQSANLVAFAGGVNAAMAREPLPVEYRLLWLRREPWRPQDTLAVGFATVITLTDPWNDVIERERIFDEFGQAGLDGLYSITDPKYDVPITAGSPAPVAPLPPLSSPRAESRGSGKVAGWRRSLAFARDDENHGSNNWAAGGNRTVDGRALLANDPHLDITMPGIWYLIDLQAPNYHVAGATLAGTAGVILGHNDHVAWGATNGNVISDSVYVSGNHERRRREVFHVRFHSDVERMYASDEHGFAAFQIGFSVYWPAVAEPSSPATTFGQLDRATSVQDALAALRAYPGPTQNFVLADTSGRVAYQMAGRVPDDPLWGMRTHAPTDPVYAAVPFDRLPQVAPSRDAVVFTANNRVYGRVYPLRLAAWFAPPYRAARIAELLRARMRYDVDYFSAMQADTLSLPERELASRVLDAARRKNLMHDATLAPLLDELTHWDARFDPRSKGASIMYALRRAVTRRFVNEHFPAAAGDAYAQSSDVFVVVMRALRERQKGYFRKDDPDGFLIGALRAVAGQKIGPWSVDGTIPVRHAFSFLGISWFNGAPLSGNGDAFTVHAQYPFAGQSFRAVWDVGDWDAGGIVIPSGESGRPGSVHYDDAVASWRAQTLVPLPFSENAVNAAARHRLVLTP